MKSEWVATKLRERISDERWPVGTRLPTEPEPAATCGIGINTVRRAMGILVDEGILVRQQGSGALAQDFVSATCSIVI